MEGEEETHHPFKQQNEVTNVSHSPVAILGGDSVVQAIVASGVGLQGLSGGCAVLREGNLTAEGVRNNTPHQSPCL